MENKKRDLTFIALQDKTIIISCDSSGGIGHKPNDVLQVDPYYVGAFTTRVALMEILAIGGTVLAISNGICNEMEYTGKKILQGIQDETKKINLGHINITGSTEENFPTTMTGVGLTAIGIIDNEKLNFEKITCGDVVGICGIPKVGGEINLEIDKDLITYRDIHNLVNWEGTKEVVPCGSKGIKYESLLFGNNLKFMGNSTIDIIKSCGPATCGIAIIKKEFKDKIIKTDAPFNIIGEYK